MGRRKRRRPHRGVSGAAARSQENERDESFDLEIVDDRQVPHPLEDVASALEEGAVVDPSELPTAPEPAPADALEPAASDPAKAAIRPPRQATFTDLHPDAETSSSDPAVDGPADAGDGPDEEVQTLGELLQQARESRGLSIEETSARTRISLKTLGSLENDRFGEFAAEAYVKGFLRNYGKFLGLDVDMLVRRYETLAGHPVAAAPAVWEEVVETRVPRKRWKPARRTVTGLVAIALVATLAWIFWSRGAARLGLRPTPGLQQIENELREAPERAPRLEAGIDAPNLPAVADPTSSNDVQASDTPADLGGATAASTAKPATAAPENAAPPAPKATVPKPPPVSTTSPAAASSKPRSQAADAPQRTPSAATTKRVVKPPPPEVKKPSATQSNSTAAEDTTPAAVRPKPKPKPTPPATGDATRRPPPPEPSDPPS